MYSATGTPGLRSAAAATPRRRESASPRSVTRAYAQPAKSAAQGGRGGEERGARDEGDAACLGGAEDGGLGRRVGVAVDDGGAADGGHGGGHGRLGDGVHGRGDAGDGERHAAGEAGGEVDGVGGEVDVAREDDHVVVGVGDALREQPRRREAVGGEVAGAGHLGVMVFSGF